MFRAWSHAIVGLDPEQRFVVLLVSVGCLTAVVITFACLIASTVRKMRQAKLNDALKREMIERGMSAEEIAQVIEADSPPEEAVDRWIASWGKKNGG